MSQCIFGRDVRDVVLRLCEDLATPVSLSVALLVRYEEWDQLSLKRVDPGHYLSSESYWADSQIVDLLRKASDLPTTIDRKAVAVENFWISEKECFRTNLRLQPYLDHRENFSSGEVDEGVLFFLDRARKIVSRVLGACPSILSGRFGPGATFGDRGKLTTVPDKMSSSPTLTPQSFGTLFPWSATAWASACAKAGKIPSFVRGNRFTTVPKDCSKDRGICIEPSLNIFYQLGLGGSIRHKLKAAGLDLQNGQDIHRQVACEASIKRHLSTIDLSNASDSVCTNLVKLLLPPRWYEALDMLRSPFTLLNGKWVRLEKFSSMGNGFTFELETLLFAAISQACLGDSHEESFGSSVFVYGDDIIVPTERSLDVMSALKFLGFSPNSRKTFVGGIPFRESCGGDFFDGVGVRPHQLKELPSEPQHWVSFANGLRRSCNGIASRWSVVRRSWFLILDQLPSAIRGCRGPQDLGDLLLHDEESRWQFRLRSSIRYFRVYRPARYRKVSWQNFRPDVILASALYGVPEGTSHMDVGRPRPEGFVVPRDAVIGYKVGWASRS